MAASTVSPAELLQKASRILERALADFESPGGNPHAVEFYELRMQAAIFNYDLTREVVVLWEFEPAGFALSVTLKDLVHKLYEYDKALSGRLVARVLSLGDARGVAIDRAGLKETRKQWRTQLTKLGGWSEVRNSASGHYGPDIAKQVRLLQLLNRDEVMGVVQAVLKYNMAVLKALVKVGQG